MMVQAHSQCGGQGFDPPLLHHRIKYLGQGGHPVWPNFQLPCASPRQSRACNAEPSEDFSQRERIRPAIGHSSSGRVTQVVKAEVSDSGFPVCLIETKLHVNETSFSPRTRKDVLACAWQSFQHRANRLIDWNEAILAILETRT